jgi:hypothetical protein
MTVRLSTAKGTSDLGGIFYSTRKSGDHAAGLPSPPEIVCILVVDAIIDEFEVEICCQRPMELIEFFRPPWTGCVLKDQANAR